MERWADSRYTGWIAEAGPVPRRPHDPDVAVWGARAPVFRAPGAWIDAGGVSEEACIGEAIERAQAVALPCDRSVEASYEDWPLDEPAVAPDAWVLFHKEQYAQPDFPFVPLRPDTPCRWVCFREAVGGAPRWVPEEAAFLEPRPGTQHRTRPGLSSGLAAGRHAQPVVLRGLQEVVERDAVVGAWWGAYGLEAWEPRDVFERLGAEWRERLTRPNLRWRFFRARSPFSDHVTLATIESEEREGFCFAVGTACRATRRESWLKAALEAVQGLHFVRHEKTRAAPPGDRPRTFPEHGLYYTYRPDELKRTALAAAERPCDESDGAPEPVESLAARLGPDRPVLARLLTPPALAQEAIDWAVVRVVVPGLQPLHGDDRLAHLGGPLWRPRGLREWTAIPPHPFP
jgi:ribosomal protein S12 methylthiotransferase accessory factor